MAFFKLLMRLLHWLTKPFSSCGDGCCKNDYHPVSDVMENLQNKEK